MSRRAWILAVGLALVALAPRPALALGSTAAELVGRLGAGMDRALTAADAGAPQSLGYAISVTIAGWPERGQPLVGALDGLLRERLEALLRGRGAAAPRVVALRAAAEGGTVEDARALGAAQGLELALLVEVEVTAGHVELRATAVRGARSFWDRAQGIGLGVVGAAFSRARLDVELLGLLGDTTGALRLAPRLSPLASRPLPTEILALAVCDADGDGWDDVVVLGRRALTVLPARGDATRLSLEALAGAEAPCRVPFGAIVPLERADGGCDLAVGTSDLRELGLVSIGADGSLRVAAVPSPGVALSGSPAEGGRAALVGAMTPGEARMGGPLWLWEAGAEPRPLTGSRAERLQRVGIKLAAPGGLDVLDAVLGRDGVLEIVGASTVQQRAWALGARGLPALVADLDDDGLAECLVTSSAVPPARDRLELLRLAPGGKVRPEWSTSSPPVRALAAGDPDGDGQLEVVVAVAAEPGADRLLLLELRQPPRKTGGGR